MIWEKFTDVRITESAKQAAVYAKLKIPYIVHLNDQNRNDSFPSGSYCVEDLQAIDDDLKDRVYRRTFNMPWNILETDRLRLREIKVDDVPSLYALYADEEITRYMEPLFADANEEIEYTKNYIENIYRFYGYGMWIVEKKDTDEIIGRAGLEYKEGFDGVEMGFMLGKKYQKKGYAYEICRHIIEYARNRLDITRFRAVVDENNLASIRLCERLGFHLNRNALNASEYSGNMPDLRYCEYILELNE